MRTMLEVAIEVVGQAAYKDYRLEQLEPGPEVLADAAALEAWMLRNVITGVLIIVVCFVGIPMQVAAHNEWIVKYVGTVHGWLYIVYTSPHLVPGHRYTMQVRSVAATTAPGVPGAPAQPARRP